jgi:hypothetical protein
MLIKCGAIIFIPFSLAVIWNMKSEAMNRSIIAIICIIVVAVLVYYIVRQNEELKYLKIQVGSLKAEVNLTVMQVNIGEISGHGNLIGNNGQVNNTTALST